MHKTWALRGRTPIIRSAGAWRKLSLIGTIITDTTLHRPRLLLTSIRGSADRYTFLRYLRDLKRARHGRKIMLFWDGLAAHRAAIVRDCIAQEKHWLRVERMPAYAPELAPPEYLWSAFKQHSGNADPDFTAVKRQVRRARRTMNDRDLLCGFLRASTLFDI